MDAEQDWAPAVLASNFDGDLHLVALTDEVTDWQVTVQKQDGSREEVKMEPASGFYYYPELEGRPSWFVGWMSKSLELSIRGRRITQLRGTRTGRIPPEQQ